MTKEIKQKTLDKVAKSFTELPAVEHKKPKDPTKKDLHRKFVMRVGRDGKAKMKEVGE